MELKRSSLGVTEVVGTFLLLGIAVAIFSVVYVTVIPSEGPPDFTKRDIVSTVEGTNIVLEHRGGHPMSLDTEISFTIGAYSKTIHPRGNLSLDTDNDDDLWNVGERVVVNFSDIRPKGCMYGNIALDYKAEEIGPGGWGVETDFSEIVNNYNGPTNLSDLDVNIQWKSGFTITKVMAVDPEENAIVFMGPIGLEHLLDYQKWMFSEEVSSLNLTFEFVDGKGSNTNIFNYYFDGDVTTRVIMHDINNKVTLPGTLLENVTIDTQSHESIGFGISSEDSSGSTVYWHTEISMNGNGMKQALVYDLGETPLGPYGSYLIGFEDLDRSGESDSDFQDMIVIVHVVSFETQ